MITREEYNKALDIVEAYQKQLFIGDVSVSLKDKKTPLNEWTELSKCPTIILNWYKALDLEYVEDMTYEKFMRCRGLGSTYWQTFISIRGY